MECDSVHVVIEKSMKSKKIEMPNDYVIVELSFDFFRIFNFQQKYKSIKSCGNNIATHIRQLDYLPNGVIKYKLNFEDFPKELRPPEIQKIIFPKYLIFQIYLPIQ